MKTTLDIYSNLLDLSNEEWNVNESKYLEAHPVDIIRDKLSKVLSYLEQLTKKINNEEPSVDDARLELISNYILAVDSLYDSFFLIIKSLTQSDTVDNKDAQIWLRKFKPNSYVSFIGSTKQQNVLIRKMANKLKHDYTKLMPMRLNNHNNNTVYGFYLSAVIGKNDLNGPDPEIHKPYKEISSMCSTAFSYNHFLLYSLNSVLHFFDKLNVALFNSKRNSTHEFSVYHQLLKISSVIEHEFYPDEYTRAYLYVEYEGNSFIVKTTYRYKLAKNVDVKRIYSLKPFGAFNPRTSTSHMKFPYLQLLKN